MEHYCRDCKYADREHLVCKPQSKDCKAEYALSEEDFETKANCDFWEKEQKNER